MRVGPGGFRLPKKPRTAGWRALAISVLALAFPAVAVAGTAPAQRTAPASMRHSAAPARVVQTRLGDYVLVSGSGYGAAGGSSIVRVLQRDLDAAGYPPGGLDGLYGPRTRRAVVAFQAAHDLQVDGIVGPRTWAALRAPALTLGPGAGDQPGGDNLVRSLQRRLAADRSSPGPIDGRYGALTEAAVRRFQGAHGLPATGIAGSRTLALLAGLEPSLRRSNVLPRKSAPSTTGSNLTSRPSGSTVAPAPREPRASGARRVLGAPAHRPRSGGVTWMLPLVGLAVALAVLCWLLIAFDRHAPGRSKGRSPAARTNGIQIHTNGHHAKASAAGISSGANNRPSRGHTDDPLGPADTAGAFNLGHPLPGQGGVVEAHATNGHSDERDHGTAASNLGRLLEEQGALAEAEAAYRRADELGDTAGAFHLGLLLEGHGGVVEAQAAYGRADTRGHGAAASNLGRLLEEQGALAEAEAAYRRADQRGDAEGALRLGVLLRQRGELYEAAVAYGRASSRGVSAADLDLGVMLAEHGELAEAEVAFGRADEGGDAVAAFNLGVLLEDRGALAEAEAAYGRADDRGDADGAFRLGVLLKKRGALHEAAAAYARASGRGHNPAALDLGVLFAERGALAEAEAAFTCADERGDAVAAFNLGVLLEDRGALAEANAAYRRAEQRDDGEGVDMARAALSELGQEVAETRRGRAGQAQNA
jgi:peptidoglycan hydrolase-like protein with peptidoglycan-binding domain